MARRAAALLALLFACLFAPATLGHHGDLPAVAAAAAPSAEGVPAHEPVPADAAMAGSRSRCAAACPGPDAENPPAAAPAAVGPRAPEPLPDLSRTARQSCSPTAGAAPTSAALQIFRC
ncbi:hypothetical protein G5C51_00370 [Streptomyces sp. A7024]|uniref:Uncharacterized protein n=1 Tax=Streptomyces coryli TaxID=1128680 RepID=A0A6G4TTL5_9ACTN|nr:hypothetical protein [Streptomyces coryli]NGN62367.1 hypothetical protein [Streptomyces coryli]